MKIGVGSKHQRNVVDGEKLLSNKIEYMNKKVSERIIRENAVIYNASEFIDFLENFKVNFDILDADNLLDYNEGFVNIEVSLLPEGESLLFIDGEYQK
jgi:hypothetical protein